MKLSLPEHTLATHISPFEAVERAYPEALSEIHEALSRGLPVLVECDKGLSPYLFRCVRERLKPSGLTAAYLDGRADGERGMVATLIAQIRDAVRGSVDRKLLVLPHLDLLTTQSNGLSAEAKEVIPLMYENPNLLWLGFVDPSFSIPRVIRDLFPKRLEIAGVPRDRLAHLVTQAEARKLGPPGFRPFELYAWVSGLHAVRLRTLLGALRGEDYPLDPGPVRAQLRQATLDAELSLPDVDLEADIGGYTSVKKRLRRDILDIVARKGAFGDEERIRRAEALIPRGIIFSGPPGTGKTMFAKAMATALGAAVQVVSGPELKSRWVGESEARLRQLFVKARQSAPSVIVFDELDAFASARGSFTGSGVEHSMVNQLLTEMDGFRKNEMVFVVGTTNFVEALDPALLRPGRFELQIEVPYPNDQDREAILRIYGERFGLELSPAALEFAVRRSACPQPGGGLATGDHLEALARAMARHRLREGLEGPSEVEDVERAMLESTEAPRLNSTEARIVATHEAGHAIVALHCEHAPPIDRISIRGDLAGALGSVSYQDRTNRYVTARAELLDRVAILFGGREAELAVLGDLSLGSAHDLQEATRIARALVEQFGMGEGLTAQDYRPSLEAGLSDGTRQRLDQAVDAVLESGRRRAAELVTTHRGALIALRDRLLRDEVVDRVSLEQLGEH